MTSILEDVGLAANVNGTILENLVKEAYKDRFNQFQTNCMAFACLAILLYDHIITFSDEVKFVWGGRNGPFKYLFLLNRYLTPLGFAVNITAYMSHLLSVSILRSIDHFIRFEGSMTVIGINVVAIMMFYRVYALYNRSLVSKALPLPLYVLLVLFCVEFGVNAFLLTKGVAVQHAFGGASGCEMIFDTTVNRAAASASAWVPLLYDSVAFGLVLWQTLPDRNVHLSGIGFGYHKRLLEDATIYFCPILLVTTVLSLMIAFAPPGSQNITAQLELIITVTMMSRITINLKKTGQRKSDIDSDLSYMPNPAEILVSHAAAQVTTMYNFTRTIVVDDEVKSDIELTPRFPRSSIALDFDVTRTFASPTPKGGQLV